jgi:hypothetical protein
MKRHWLLLAAAALVVLQSGCREERNGMPPEPRKTAVQESRPGRIRVEIKEAVLWAELADRPASREQGLMFRRSLPEDEAMLFVFEYPQMQSFWMRNTYLPLDIAFLSEQKVIINILTMKPLDEGPRYRSLAPALYVIETNAGWFQKNGIKPGDRAEF